MSQQPAPLHRRIRWGNLARAAGVVALIALVVAWPHLGSRPPALPPSAAQPVVEPPPANEDDARPRVTPTAVGRAKRSRVRRVKRTVVEQPKRKRARRARPLGARRVKRRRRSAARIAPSGAVPAPASAPVPAAPSVPAPSVAPAQPAPATPAPPPSPRGEFDIG